MKLSYIGVLFISIGIASVIFCILEVNFRIKVRKLRNDWLNLRADRLIRQVHLTKPVTIYRFKEWGDSEWKLDVYVISSIRPDAPVGISTTWEWWYEVRIQHLNNDERALITQLVLEEEPWDSNKSKPRLITYGNV